MNESPEQVDQLELPEINKTLHLLALAGIVNLFVALSLLNKTEKITPVHQLYGGLSMAAYLFGVMYPAAMWGKRQEIKQILNPPQEDEEAIKESTTPEN